MHGLQCRILLPPSIASRASASPISIPSPWPADPSVQVPARSVTQCMACNAVGRIDSAIPSPSTVGGLATRSRFRERHACGATSPDLACAKSTQDRGSEWVGSVPVFFRDTRYVPGPKALGSPRLGHRPGAPYTHAERFSAQRANRFRCQATCVPCGQGLRSSSARPRYRSTDLACKERTVSQSPSRIWLHIVFRRENRRPVGPTTFVLRNGSPGRCPR